MFQAPDRFAHNRTADPIGAGDLLFAGQFLARPVASLGNIPCKPLCEHISERGSAIERGVHSHEFLTRNIEAAIHMQAGCRNEGGV